MSTQVTKQPTVEDAHKTHHEPIIRDPGKCAPKQGRFANSTQMVFHPRPEDLTEPNAGIVTYHAGASFPLHKHDFAQVWYVLEGECMFGESKLKAGDMVYMRDPHFEYAMSTEKGCKILFIQYPGPTTGERPVYDGRFDRTAPSRVEEEDLDH